jgi:hypothetical protein
MHVTAALLEHQLDAGRTYNSWLSWTNREALLAAA